MADREDKGTRWHAGRIAVAVAVAVVALGAFVRPSSATTTGGSTTTTPGGSTTTTNAKTPTTATTGPSAATSSTLATTSTTFATTSSTTTGAGTTTKPTNPGAASPTCVPPTITNDTRRVIVVVSDAAKFPDLKSQPPDGVDVDRLWVVDKQKGETPQGVQAIRYDELQGRLGAYLQDSAVLAIVNPGNPDEMTAALAAFLPAACKATDGTLLNDVPSALTFIGQVEQSHPQDMLQIADDVKLSVDAQSSKTAGNLVVRSSARVATLTMPNPTLVLASVPANTDGTLSTVEVPPGKSVDVQFSAHVKDPTGGPIEGTAILQWTPPRGDAPLPVRGEPGSDGGVASISGKVRIDRPEESTTVAVASPTDSNTNAVIVASVIAVLAAAGIAFVVGRNLNRATLADGAANDVPRPPATTAVARGPAPAPAWPLAPPPMPGSWVRFLGSEPAIQIVEREDAMRVQPKRIDAGRTWAVSAPDVIAMSLWTEKIDGKGEDAEPSFHFDTVQRRGFLATFDGMGGAGAATVRTRSDGSEMSGAFVASRVVREATQKYLRENLALVTDPPVLAAGLHDELSNQLAIELQRCTPTSSKIAGMLRRDLPTTLAAVAFEIDPNGGILAASLWAGDSRTHLLTSYGGLQQLTRDDTPDGDALSLLINDAPMTNVVCADRPFEVNEYAVSLHAPAVLVSATDGCFGYVATPAHYELLLLRTLVRAADPDDWAAKLAAELAGFTSDDASLTLVAIGYRDFSDLQDSYADRARTLEEEHAEPFNGATPDDFDAFAALRRDSWNRYKDDYEALMAPRPLDDDAVADPVASGAGDAATAPVATEEIPAFTDPPPEPSEDPDATR